MPGISSRLRDPRLTDTNASAKALTLISTVRALVQRGLKTAATLVIAAAATALPAVADVPFEPRQQHTGGLTRTLFTDDAWQGMLRVQEYGRYCRTLSDLEAQPDCQQCEENRKVLEQAWQVVANDFYDSTEKFNQAAWAQQLLATLQEAGGALRTKPELYSAAESMVGHLNDRYSAFLPPSQFRRALMRPLPAERNYYAAQFVGIGLQLGAVSPDGGRIVDAPLAGSPAEAAGIVRGDRILQIDGRSAADMSLDSVSAALRGPAGSPVSVRWARSGHELTVPTTTSDLERAALPQPPLIEARLPLPGGGGGASVSYLRIHFFSHETTRSVTQAVEDAERDGVAGYVLDLRNDPGGVFEEAVAIASLFLPSTTAIVETVHSADYVDNVWRAGQPSSSSFGELPPMLTSRPVVVLVNGSTASASEVLTGALHDNRRALLVGQRTFGKGLVQYYYPMSDSSGLKLTVAKYLTPKGWDISRRGGLSPDIVCDDFPHGVLSSSSSVDRCARLALDHIRDVAPRQHPGSPTVRAAPTLPVSPLMASPVSDPKRPR